MYKNILIQGLIHKPLVLQRCQCVPRLSMVSYNFRLRMWHKLNEHNKDLRYSLMCCSWPAKYWKWKQKKLEVHGSHSGYWCLCVKSGLVLSQKQQRVCTIINNLHFVENWKFFVKSLTQWGGIVKLITHICPSNAEVKNAWSYTSTPWIYLHGVVLS
jgi:hypothetical protein